MAVTTTIRQLSLAFRAAVRTVSKACSERESIQHKMATMSVDKAVTHHGAETGREAVHTDGAANPQCHNPPTLPPQPRSCDCRPDSLWLPAKLSSLST